MTSRRDYFAAHCPESWIKTKLGNRSINAYKRYLHSKKIICSRDLNEYGWEPAQELYDLADCLVRFDYADMMIKAADYGEKQ